MNILITNNPLVSAEYLNAKKPKVEYLETNLLDLLIHIRNYIHKGHKLLTHPLSGSVKPNETLYKSVLISEKTNTTDLQSVKIIEECIAVTQKFAQRKISDEHLKDLQTVDLSLIRVTLDKN